MLALIPVVVLLFVGVAASAEPIRIYRDILLDASGNARLERSTEVPKSALSELYEDHQDAVVSDRETRDQFFEELVREYAQLFSGRRVERMSIENSLSDDAAFRRTTSGQVAGLARIDQDRSLWRISVGPHNEELSRDSASRVLDSFIFQSLFLQSLEGRQDIRTTVETRFILPPDAVLANSGSLVGRSWEVDFGGGNRMVGGLSIEGAHQVVLTEELVATEEAPSRLLHEPASVLEQYRDYIVFAIEYERPSNANAPGTPYQTAYACVEDFGKSWSYDPEIDFDWDPWDYCNSADQFESKLWTEPEMDFHFGAYVGWDFDWFKLDWFKAYVDCNGEFLGQNRTLAHYELGGGHRGPYTYREAQFDKHRTFNFYVGFLPVWIRFGIEAGPGAEIEVWDPPSPGQDSLDSVWTWGWVVTTKWGAQYDNGWSVIHHHSGSIYDPALEYHHGTEWYTKSGAYVEINALIYNVAGPFISGFIYGADRAYYNGGQQQVTRHFRGEFKVDGGVRVAGWLSNLLGISSQWTWNLTEWASGMTTQQYQAK